MLFRRSFRHNLFFNFKTFFLCRNSLSKFSSFKIPTKLKKKFSASRILLASAAVGFSIYVASNQIIFCETLDISTVVQPKFAVKNYDEAIHKSRDIIHRLKDEVGIPGIVVGVSVNGETVWTEGFGYADVENRVLCSADTVMRIASISKPITMAAVAKLWEQGKLDLDKPIQDYVPYFPLKTFDGKPITITTRHLVSHLGGIRHYKIINSTSKNKEQGTEKKEKESEFDYEHYHLKNDYKDIKSSLDIFKDDPLEANPGSKFVYSTFGYTLLSAIVEAASKEDFPTHIKKLFQSLRMDSTYLDLNDPLIFHRSRYYMKDERGRLINAPYANSTYKWAGGGILSTVGDLLQFGNAMLYSFQYGPDTPSKNELKSGHKKTISSIDDNTLASSELKLNRDLNKKKLPGFLSPATVKALWTPVTKYKKTEKYGMGWVISPESNECMFCERRKFCVYHTGGATGATSILLIMPNFEDIKIKDLSEIQVPNGIIVTLLMNIHYTNLHNVCNLRELALNIAESFDNSKHCGYIL